MFKNMPNAIKLIAITLITTASNVTLAHEGHGLDGSHWHATDVGGFVAVAALIALALWLSRGDK